MNVRINTPFKPEAIRSEYMEDSYPRLLKEAGYYTGFFGKFGVNYAEKDQLFDEMEDYDRNGTITKITGDTITKLWDEDTVHLTRYTGQKALDFIDNAPYRINPFACPLSFSAPHAHDRCSASIFLAGRTGQACIRIWICRDRLWAKTNILNSLPEPVRDGFNRLALDLAIRYTGKIPAQRKGLLPHD